jgi:hypothetical protein
MAEETLSCNVLLIDGVTLDFGDARWELSENSLKLFNAEDTLFIAEFPREAVIGIWRQAYTIEEP